MIKTAEERERAQQDMRVRLHPDPKKTKAAYMKKYMRKRRFKAKEVRRVTRYRKRKKAEALAAWHAANKAVREARAARRAAREQKKALDLRKHATQHQGFIDGFQTNTPQTDVELKALSYAKRYRIGYAEGRAERQRCDALLNQQARPTPAPVTIRLS